MCIRDSYDTDDIFGSDCFHPYPSIRLNTYDRYRFLMAARPSRDKGISRPSFIRKASSVTRSTKSMLTMKQR